MIKLSEKDRKELDTFLKTFTFNISENFFASYDGECDWLISRVNDYAEFSFSDSFEIFNGISKMVIVFDNRDYVVKIPFQGEYVYVGLVEDEEDEEELNHYYTQDSKGDWFSSFGNADWWGKSEWDYCEAEVAVYQNIKEKHPSILSLFAESELYGIAENSLPVYIQTKGGALRESGYTQRPSAKSLKEVKDINEEVYNPFYDDWLAMVIDLDGVEVAKDLLEWVRKSFDNVDFHNGNYGFTDNGTPIIIDYSGFEG